MFSKKLQEFSFKELGRKLKELGFDGVDLTVRAGGHIKPEEVRDKLPEAKEALGYQGINISMITTAIREIDEPYARDVLEAAGAAGVGYFKLRPFRYEGFGTLRQSMAEVSAKLKGLEPVCRESGIRLGFQTHSQNYLGASVPHILRMIEKCDPGWASITISDTPRWRAATPPGA
jgi:sugar phosphate isomerase/epimerase